MSQILGGLVLVFGMTTLAGAQAPSDFQALAATVHPGDRVVVTESSGRKYTTTIIETSPSTLTVSGRRQRPPRVLTQGDIARVDRPDPAVNGVLIGMAAGVALAAVSCTGDGGSLGEACTGVTGLFLLPLGGFFGALVDASVHRRLYVAPLPPGTIRLGFDRRGGASATVSVGW